jgi:hypothetical protein
VHRSGIRHVCCSRKPSGEAAQTTHAAPARRPGQCVKRPIAPALIGWPCCLHSPREEPKWLTPHPSRSRSTADCRPLLQQSLPNRGRVVQPGKRAAPTAGSHLVRLTDRHSICTAAGALSGEPTAHTWNVRPQAPTPAASFSLLGECSLIHHPRALLGGLFRDKGCLLSVFDLLLAAIFRQVCPQAPACLPVQLINGRAHKSST